MNDVTLGRLFTVGFIVGWIAFSIGTLALAAYAVAKAVAFAGVCA